MYYAIVKEIERNSETNKETLDSFKLWFVNNNNTKVHFLKLV